MCLSILFLILSNSCPACLISRALEIRQAGHEFDKMRKRIERHINQRTEMLSGISHDLRTPLTRMKLQLANCSFILVKGVLKS